MPREAVRKAEVAEQIAGHLPILIKRAARRGAEFEIVPAVEPAHMILELLGVVQEARMTPRGLRNGGDAETGKGDLRHALHVRQIGGEVRETKVADHLEAHQRAMSRIVVPGVAPTKFVHQVATDGGCVGKLSSARVARLPTSPDGRQSVIEVARIGAVPRIASEYGVLIGEAMVDARSQIRIRVELAQELQPQVLRAKCLRIRLIRQRVKALLNLERDRIQSF